MEKKRLVRATLVDDIWIGEDGIDSCSYMLHGNEIEEKNHGLFNAILTSKDLAKKIHKRLDEYFTAICDDIKERYFGHGFGYDVIFRMCGITSKKKLETITEEQLIRLVNSAKKQVNLSDVKSFILDIYKLYAKESLYDLNDIAKNSSSRSIGFTVYYEGNTYKNIVFFGDIIHDCADIIVQSVVDKYFETDYNKRYKNIYFDVLDNIIDDFIETYISDDGRFVLDSFDFNTRAASQRANRKFISSSISDMKNELQDSIDALTNIDDSPSTVKSITPTMHESLSELTQQM